MRIALGLRGYVLISALAILSAGGVYAAINPSSPAKITLQFQDPDGPLRDLAWSPNGHQLVLSDSAGFRIMDSATGRITATITGLDNPIGAAGSVIGFTDGGARLILPGPPDPNGREALSIRDAQTGRQVGQIDNLYGKRPSDAANALSETPDGRLLVISTPFSLGAQIYDTRQKQVLFTIPGSVDISPLSFALDARGRFVAAALQDKALVVYNLPAFQLTGRTQIPLPLDQAFATALSFSPAGDQLALGFINAGVIQTTAENGQVINVKSTWPRPPVYVWRLVNGVPQAPPKALCQPSAEGAIELIWLPDGSAIVYSDDQGNVRLCQLNGGTDTMLLATQPPVLQQLSLSPDGKYLAAGQGFDIAIVQLPKLAGEH